MRRRYRPTGPLVPNDLAVFSIASWSVLVESLPPLDYGGTAEQWTANEAHAAWCRARAMWSEVNGWPGGNLERIREERRVRLALPTSGVVPRARESSAGQGTP